MGYFREISLVTAEPVLLTDQKAFSRVVITQDDALIGVLITAARVHAEKATGRILAQRSFAQVLDSFPYFTDTVQSQQAYPPNYYSLPRYSTTLWNYSQQIKLQAGPVKSVDLFRFVNSSGNSQTLLEATDFVLDRQSEPARIFPMPGQFWPACLYVPNAVEIHFTAGYDPNPLAAPDVHSNPDNPPNAEPDSTVLLGIPQDLRLAIMMLATHWYANREPGGATSVVPMHVQALLDANTLYDFSPTRG